MFAIEATLVREILDLVAITEVPLSKPFVNGLINVRGKVVPLADLRIKFGMKQRPPTVDTRIVVVELELEDEPVTVGVRADKVHEVTEIAATALRETPRVGTRWRPEFIQCVGKRGEDFIVLLDITRVLLAATMQETSLVASALKPVAAQA
jgi:purine-binding chemotaxis protein CheW